MGRTRAFYLKVFLYFGGAAILLLGGAIIVSAPYHYTGFIASAGDAYPFVIYDNPDYYPRMEISVTAKAENASIIHVDFRIVNNYTSEVRVLNMSMTENDLIPGTNPRKYLQRQVVELSPGPYTIYIDRIDGVSWVDVSYEQLSDKVRYIGTGLALNIAGLVMMISGYFVSGSLITSDEPVVVRWGYDEEESYQDST